MKKFSIVFITLLIIFFAVYSIYYLKSDELVIEDTPVAIGGDRDDFGCLSGAGYGFDDEIDACVRSWEIDTVDTRKAAVLAIEEVGSDNGLTVTEIIPQRCPGCFMINLENKGVRTFTRLEDWGVVEVGDIVDSDILVEKVLDGTEFKNLLHTAVLENNESLEEVGVGDIREVFIGFLDEDFDSIEGDILSDDDYGILLLQTSERFGIDISIDEENVYHLIEDLMLDSVVPIEADYGYKVVYGSDQNMDIDALRLDCADRGGEFSDCGSVCENDADMCIDVCVFVCEIEE